MGNPYMMNAAGSIINGGGTMGTDQQQRMGFQMITPSLVQQQKPPQQPGYGQPGSNAGLIQQIQQINQQMHPQPAPQPQAAPQPPGRQGILYKPGYRPN